MPQKDSESARKPSYWLALAVGAVVLIWIAVEAVFAGFTENVGEAAATVTNSGGAIIASVASLVASILALRNFTPDADLHDPIEHDPR